MQNKTIKLPAAIVKAARLFQAKNDVRYYLVGIQLNNTGCIVATNGHVLIKIDHEPLKDLEESLIVRIHGTKITQKAQELEFVFLDDLRGVVRMYNGHGFLMDDVRSFELVEGKFPDYKNAMPKGDLVAVNEMGINPHYMDIIAQAQHEIGIKHAGVGLKFRGQHNGIEVNFKSAEYEALAVVMPMRL